MLYGLDLFSGIGGNSLALRDYVKTVAYCERDRHAQSVLLSRMQDGKLARAPIWDDVSTLRKEQFNIPIDIIVAGFPCQDISTAGNGAGLEGKRSGLFFEVIRLAEELEPSFIFLENVPAIRTRGLSTVLKQLAEAGYDCRYGFLSAFDVGAPHKRERWFLLANNKIERCIKGLEFEKQTRKPNLAESSRWETEPYVGRVVYGVPLRVDRIKRLGNAVVPNQAKEAFERLMFMKTSDAL